MKKIASILFLVLLVACQEENQPPTCIITSPSDGDELEIGEVIPVSADADDPDGSVSEVRFYIDGSGVGSSASFPYRYEWNTTDSEPGVHKITAKAYDNAGLVTENEISIRLNLTISLPLVETSPISEITQTTATGGGNVTDDGNADITERGICWSMNQTPTIADNMTLNGTGTGEYTSLITQLDPETTYYVRAYASNNEGTAYGNVMSFTTDEIPATLPILSTSPVTSITSSSAQSGGDITSDGGSPVTGRGVCWSTSSGPTISDTKSSSGTGIGSFSSTISGLISSTTYYIKAYATNSVGTAYGTQHSFTTSSASAGTISDFDGNSYETVQIGEQIWMAENLRSTHYSDGAEISDVSVYNNEESNAAVYGRLYTYNAMMKGAATSDANPSGIQGVCPSKWHLPSDSEWKELEMTLGMSEIQANSSNARGTNQASKLAGNADLWSNGNLESDAAFGTSGFMALPGGFLGTRGSHLNIADRAYFWSCTTAENGIDTWIRVLVYDGTQVHRGQQQNRSINFSVRCVKDQ